MLRTVNCQEQACRSHCLCGRLTADGLIELASGRSGARPQGRPAAGGKGAGAAGGEGAGDAAVAANRHASRATGEVHVQVAPAPPPVPVAAHAPVRSPRRRERSRSPPPTAEEEHRRCSRATIEERFRRQWRKILKMEDRPLPPPGRADSGIVVVGSWADGLRGNARKRTVELLKTNRWQKHKEHSSVHLTMYLR